MQTRTSPKKETAAKNGTMNIKALNNPMQLLSGANGMNPLQAVGESESGSVIKDKSAFLDQLYKRLHEVGTDAFSGTNLTVDSCPMMSEMMIRYSGEPAVTIEKIALRYASASNDIAVDDLIEKICDRAKMGFEKQASTGELTEIPDSLPAEEIKRKLPTPEMVLQGKFTGNPLSEGVMQFGGCLPGGGAAAPRRVDVPMDGCHTVNDNLTTLRTGGFSGCIGLVMFNGANRTVAHISSTLVAMPEERPRPKYQNFLQQVRAAALTATHIQVYNAVSGWAPGDGSDGDALIADFGLNGGAAAINFVPGQYGSYSVSPAGVVTPIPL